MIVSRWHAFRAQVLEYNGSGYRQWGLPQLLTWAHLPGAAAWLAGPGRFAILLVSGLAAAAVAWRRPDAVVPAVGLSFVLFLVLSPAFGMQYLAWALAGAYLIDTGVATAYNVAASVFVVVVYDHWSDALPVALVPGVGGPVLPARARADGAHLGAPRGGRSRRPAATCAAASPARRRRSGRRRAGSTAADAGYDLRA